MAKLWLQKARERMQKKGTVGSFSGSNKKGESTQQHASRILNSSNASGLQKKRANFARLTARFNRNRSK